MKPILSIITINRNNAEGLKKTLTSVLSQKNIDFIKDVEYIVIDGNSTDTSVQIIRDADKKYKNKISYWISEPDKGIYNAMNKGIQNSHGKYIHLLNSGDYYEKDVLSDILEKLKSNPDVLLSAINMVAGNTITRIEIRTLSNLKDIPLNHQGLIYKKKFHDSYGLYSEELKFASDYKFCIEAFYDKKLKISYLYKPAVFFDITGVGNSDKSKKEIDLLHYQYFNIIDNAHKPLVKRIVKNILPYGIVQFILKKLCSK